MLTRPQAHIRFLIVALLMLIVTPTCAGENIGPIDAEPSKLWTEFIGERGVSLADLTAGAVGRGVLVVHSDAQMQPSPRLVVELERVQVDGPAVARVFPVTESTPEAAAPIGNRPTGGDPRERTPAIIIEAPAGWWTRGTQVNYDLDISIFGGIYSLWSPTSWMYRVRNDQPTVEITLRDRNGDGTPDFDLRRLLVFSQDGYYHVNYAERMCDGPIEFDLGLVPEWPFIASPRIGDDGQLRAAGAYEQRNGHLRPPIVVDWSTGRIEYFSELVTLRNQSCSYGLYSTRPMQEGSINELSFETPFAFYDLREARDGFPDLIIRSVYSPSNVTPSERVPRDTIEGTRYSWRTDDRAAWGLHFDYKVELAGHHSYDAETPIAGGFARINAPGWTELPSWLIGRDWPFVTFVSTEGNHYRSNEGIYEWSTRALGPGILHGAVSSTIDLVDLGLASPDSGPYNSIRRGLRGEFRLGDAAPAALYLSPLSNRLHLLGAIRGVHDLGPAGTLHAENLLQDAYLDSWLLDSPSGTQRLVHLPGWLVLASGTQVSLAAVDVPHSVGVVLPPTDHESWVTFRDRVTPITDAKRPASDLATWFDAHADAHTTLDGVTLVDVWHQPGAIHFLLEVTPGAAPAGFGGTPALTPGGWVLAFDLENRGWSVIPARPAALMATLVSTGLEALSAQHIDMVIANTGTVVARGRATVAIDGLPVASWGQLSVPADGVRTESISWVPPIAGWYAVTLEFAGAQYALGDIEVAAPRRAGLATAATLSLGPAAIVLAVAAIIAFAVASRLVTRGRS